MECLECRQLRRRTVSVSRPGIFLLTAAASTLATGLGYALDVPFGPTAVLYLLAAS